MKQLRELCSRLSKEGAVAALLAAMQADSNISSFEFLNSGTVHQLKDYLLGAPALLPLWGAVQSAVQCTPPRKLRLPSITDTSRRPTYSEMNLHAGAISAPTV